MRDGVQSRDDAVRVTVKIGGGRVNGHPLEAVEGLGLGRQQHHEVLEAGGTDRRQLDRVPALSPRARQGRRPVVPLADPGAGRDPEAVG